MSALVAIAPYISVVGRPVYMLLAMLGLWLGLGRTPLERPARIVTWLAVAAPLLAWFLLMNRIGQLNIYGSAPWARPVAVLVPPAIWLLMLTRSPRIAAVIDAIPPSWLVGLQVFRVLGFTFLVLWAAGRIPGTFALPAGIGDMLTGSLALPAALYIHRRARHWRIAGYALNLIGLSDFAIALSIAFIAAPMRLPYPFVLIPTFSVPFYMVVHGLSLWQLARIRTVAGSSQSNSPDTVKSPLPLRAETGERRMDRWKGA